MTAGKLEGPIFPAVMVAKLRARWQLALSRAGFDPRPRACDALATLDFRLIEAVGAAFQDRTTRLQAGRPRECRWEWTSPCRGPRPSTSAR